MMVKKYLLNRIRFNEFQALISLLSLFTFVVFSSTSFALNITEIHYNPPGTSENLEFIEISNDSSTPEDLSGYTFSRGLLFTFPKDTILPAHGIIVIASDPAAVEAEFGIENVMGPYLGQLDNGGERITIVNQSGIEMIDLSYSDDGKWPTEPDGTGHTLALLNKHMDPSEPEHWTWSPQIGGTPGAINFQPADDPTFIETVIVEAGVNWRYKKGTEEFSNPIREWMQPDFNDATWTLAPPGYGYGDNDDRTPLNDMQGSYFTVACRLKFNLTAEILNSPGDIFLGIIYDDGFCGAINGTEFSRNNCGDVGETLAFDDNATGSHEANDEEFYQIPKNLLVEGENTIAVIGHNFSLNSSDFSLDPRIVHRRLESSETSSDRPVVFNEIQRDPTEGQSWLELYNRSAFSQDLSLYKIALDPDQEVAFTLPANTTLDSKDFLGLNEATTGLKIGEGPIRLFLFSPDGSLVSAEAFEELEDSPLGELTAEALHPDGGDRVEATPVATFGASNQVPTYPCLVINEILYNAAGDRPNEFVEIHNPCEEAIDLTGFRFTRGVDYDFPDGTTLQGGEYLVIAEDPEWLKSHYDITNVLGPYEGRLSNRGENLRFIDPNGIIVDEVRYFDGGNWAGLADGKGSSLELIDPLQDNDVASAWNSSLESHKAEWHQYSFHVPNYRTTSHSELHIYLLEGGICRIDDVEIRRNGGSNIIPNPGFESTTSPWLLGGTHIDTHRTTADSRSGSACLEIVASGKGDTTVNRIETDTSPRMSTGPYDVSFWAKWVEGTTLITAHGEYSAGPFRTPHSPSTNISGNAMAKTFRMILPDRLGTPGKENSRTQELRDQTGSTNLGPVVSEVEHNPPIPQPGVAVQVSAKVSDFDGVESVLLKFRTNNAQGIFSTSEVFDDGAHGDGQAQDGIYGGTLPGHPRGTRVLYYFEATDTVGNTRRFPPSAPEKVLMVMPDNYSSTNLNQYSYFLDTAKSQELSSRHRLSNELLDGTFVFNNEKAYYNVGIRYRGSPWGRSSSNFRISFNDDRPFNRGRQEINISSRAGSGKEAAAYFLVGRASAPDKPAPTADYLYHSAKFNGGGLSTRAMIQPVDADYHRKWYGNDGDGVVLKAVGRLQFDDPGANWSWEGANLVYRDREVENYRGYYRHSIRQGADDWERLMDLAEIIDRTETPTAEFALKVDDVLDVEAFLRVFAPNILFNGWDQYLIGNGHNGYLALDPIDQRWELLPFDMDNSFSGNPNVNPFGSRDPDITRLLTTTWVRRLYTRILYEYSEGYWSRDGATPFLSSLQSTTGIGFAGILNYLAGSDNSIKNLTRASINVDFEITSNDGEDFEVDEDTVELEGEASALVDTLTVQRNDGEIEPLNPTWVSPIRWRASLALSSPLNTFNIIGYSGSGDIIGTDSITVATSNVDLPPEITAWFPNVGPGEGGTEVTIFGKRLLRIDSVDFGIASTREIDYLSDEAIIVTSPPAQPPLPAEDKVDLIFRNDGADEIARLVKGFQYELTGTFVRGDANRNGRVELGDAITVFLHLYRGLELQCEDAADTNDDGEIEMVDGVSILNFIYLEGNAPLAPYPGSGIDPNDDDLAECN